MVKVKMVKVKKVTFFILFAFAVAAFAVTLILLFVPEPKPVKIIEKFYIEEQNGTAVLHGKIRNDSGADRTFRQFGQQITVTVRVDGKDQSIDIFKDEVTVCDGESYEVLKELPFSYTDAKVKKVSAHLFKKNYSMNYTVYGKVINEGSFLIASAFVGFAGFLFLVGAISNLIGNIIIAKRANKIIDDISQKFGGGIYAAGYFGDKKQERTDATKTAFGLLGATISATFLGIGFYRDRVNRRRRNFVITHATLYEVNGKKMTYTNLMPQVRGIFNNAPVTEKGNKLTMTGADGRSYLTFIPEKDEKQKLITALNALFNPQEN